MQTLTVQPFLLMLMLGLTLTTGFHVAYKVNAGHVGIAKIGPWLSRRGATVRRVTMGLVMRFAVALRLAVDRHRRSLAMGAVLVALALWHPSHVAGFAMLGTVATFPANGNIAQLERDLEKKRGEAKALFEKTARDAQDAKNDKGEPAPRERTEDERKAVQALIDEANALKARIDRIKGDESMSAEIEKLTSGMTAPKGAGAVQIDRRTMGQQFVESPAMDFFKKGMHRTGSAWRSPSVELHAGVLDTTGPSGGDLIVTQYRPGILPLLFKRLVVADLLAPGTTDSNSVSYMKETTFTNASGPVAEGAPKPESTLAFDLVNDLVAKIAHWLPVTEEMLEDVAQIRSYIDARLRLGLDVTEEDQLLNGSGTSPAMTGLLNRTGLTTATVRSGSTTNADAIFTAMMAVFNASFVMPTGTIMNPANWQTTALSKDGNGQYYGAGPFAGPQTQVLWGLPVVVTPSIVANTAFTGAFNSAAQVFRKGGVRVEASNSHSDFFIRNLVAIRAEERLALAVYRPAAFSKITSLT